MKGAVHVGAARASQSAGCRWQIVMDMPIRDEGTRFVDPGSSHYSSRLSPDSISLKNFSQCELRTAPVLCGESTISALWGDC